MFDFLADSASNDSLRATISLFALVLARIVPIIELTPFLGGRATPRTVKTAAALAVGLLVYPTVATPEMLLRPPGAVEFTLLVAKEALLGLTLGFVTALVFEAVRIGGQVIDAARGQTMANALVPQLPERASVSADYLYQLSIALFFVLGGHRLYIAAIVRSYQTINPLGYMGLETLNIETALLVARITSDAIALGVGFALPVVAAILLADVVLALINKSAPQVNVFFLGMPLKALLGVGVLLLSLGLFADTFALAAFDGLERLDAVITQLGGDRVR